MAPLSANVPDRYTKIDISAQVSGTSRMDLPVRRFYWFAGIFFFECLIISYLRRPWLSNPSVKPVLIVFTGIVVLLAGSRLPTPEPGEHWLHKRFLALHGAAVLVVGRVYLFLLGSATPDIPLSLASACLWYGSLALLFLTLASTLASVRYLGRALVSLRLALGYATACALLVMPLRGFLQAAWNAPQTAVGRMLQLSCFRGVVFLLRLFYPRVLYDPATAAVGTPAFLISIAGGCSGVEGLALMAALSLLALFFYRHELRLARAALLIPFALVAVWMLNIVRIVILIAIGNAGFVGVALDGFHSAAGWIFLNATAICFLVVVHRVPWIRRASRTGEWSRSGSALPSANTVAASLGPFLAILACSLLTRAVSSGGFEAFYPARLVVGAAALWVFREQYRRGELADSLRIDGQSAWLGCGAGVAIGFLWIGLSRLLPSSAADTTATALAQLPAWQRLGWLAARVVAAVMTVPLAEELAFRWYLARRLAGTRFQEVPLSRLNPPAILLSSVVFGLLHGRIWLAGTLAGVLLALVARKRGRLGDAVMAHAVSNLLLAAWVLIRHDYTLW